MKEREIENIVEEWMRKIPDHAEMDEQMLSTILRMPQEKRISLLAEVDGLVSRLHMHLHWWKRVQQIEDGKPTLSLIARIREKGELFEEKHGGI